MTPTIGMKNLKYRAQHKIVNTPIQVYKKVLYATDDISHCKVKANSMKANTISRSINKTVHLDAIQEERDL